MVEVIFFKIWAYTIFFATKFQFREKNLLCPLVANDEKKIFCLKSTQKCSQVSKTLLYFPDNFFNSLWPFQTNSALKLQKWVCKPCLYSSTYSWKKWVAIAHPSHLVPTGRSSHSKRIVLTQTSWLMAIKIRRTLLYCFVPFQFRGGSGWGCDGWLRGGSGWGCDWNPRPWKPWTQTFCIVIIFTVGSGTLPLRPLCIGCNYGGNFFALNALSTELQGQKASGPKI